MKHSPGMVFVTVLLMMLVTSVSMIAWWRNVHCAHDCFTARQVNQQSELYAVELFARAVKHSVTTFDTFINLLRARREVTFYVNDLNKSIAEDATVSLRLHSSQNNAILMQVLSKATENRCIISRKRDEAGHSLFFVRGATFVSRI